MQGSDVVLTTNRIAMRQGFGGRGCRDILNLGVSAALSAARKLLLEWERVLVSVI